VWRAKSCGSSDVVKPSAGLSCVEMADNINWSVETQSRREMCVLSMWRVRRVGRLALAIATAAALSS